MSFIAQTFPIMHHLRVYCLSTAGKQDIFPFFTLRKSHNLSLVRQSTAYDTKNTCEEFFFQGEALKQQISTWWKHHERAAF